MTFSVGQWIQWQTDTSVKRGQIVELFEPSMVVRWLDGEVQVFPVIEYALAMSRLVVIERPKEAGRIERDRARGVMSLARAASTLGTTQKRVRAMLRSGQLRGEQQDGKWISVEL